MISYYFPHGKICLQISTDNMFHSILKKEEKKEKKNEIHLKIIQINKP